MMKKIKSMTHECLFLSIALAVFSGTGILHAIEWGSPTSDYVEAVVACVGDKVITTSDIRQMTASEIRALPSDMPAEERKKAVEEIYTQAVDRIVDSELIYLEFQSLKAKVPEKYVQQRIDEIILREGHGEEETFRDFLHSQQMTWQEFQEKVYKQIAIEMLTYDRTRRNLNISDYQIDTYYQEHKNEFSAKRMCRLQVLMLKKDNADELERKTALIYKSLDEKVDFDSLVVQYSDSPEASKNHGLMDWQEYDSLAPALHEAVKGLSAGQVAKSPIDIGEFRYVICLKEIRGAQEGDANLKNEKIRQQIRDILTDEIIKDRYKKYIHSLYIKFPVRRMDRM